jgi:hypothetical protein
MQWTIREWKNDLPVSSTQGSIEELLRRRKVVSSIALYHYGLWTQHRSNIRKFRGSLGWMEGQHAPGWWVEGGTWGRRLFWYLQCTSALVYQRRPANICGQMIHSSKDFNTGYWCMMFQPRVKIGCRLVVLLQVRRWTVHVEHHFNEVSLGPYWHKWTWQWFLMWRWRCRYAFKWILDGRQRTRWKADLSLLMSDIRIPIGDRTQILRYNNACNEQ